MYVQVLEQENRVAEAKKQLMSYWSNPLILPFGCVSQKHPSCPSSPGLHRSCAAVPEVVQVHQACTSCAAALEVVQFCQVIKILIRQVSNLKYYK
jgi:hypothetical protein